MIFNPKPSGRILLLIAGIFLINLGVINLWYSATVLFVVWLVRLGLETLADFFVSIIPQFVVNTAYLIPINTQEFGYLNIPTPSDVAWFITRSIRLSAVLTIIEGVLLMAAGIMGIVFHNRPQKAIFIGIFASVALLYVLFLSISSFSPFAFLRLFSLVLFAVGIGLNIRFYRKMRDVS